MIRTRRNALVAAAAGLSAAALVFVGVQANQGTPVPGGQEQEQAARDELPTALGQHLEQLKESIPGNGGEPGEGPQSAAEWQFQQRAYPANTISVAQQRTAMRAFRSAELRAAAAPGRRPGTGWVNVGPRRALYPHTKFRNVNSYVPNKYVAGGRVTDLAISPTCVPHSCRLWVTPAGGGVWRSDNPLAKRPRWTYLGGPLGINAAGSVTVDPADSSGNTIWVGTGEANICGSGCVAGTGLYKSTNGGDTWSGPWGKAKLGGKGIGDLAIDPTDGTMYAATTTALRGMSSVCCSGVTRPVPGAAKWGLYKSSDGGRRWHFVHNGSKLKRACTGDINEFNNASQCSPRGVRWVRLDPSDPNTVYASSYARGIWRSNDRGKHWSQIKQSLNRALIPTIAAIDVTTLRNGNTRMYAYEGNVGDPYARLFRSDNVYTGTPSFTDLSSPDPADPGYATYDQCGGQCWYDSFVYTPQGHPNVVYTGGSYGYGETGGISNGRGVVLSTDAGVSGTDMTMDGTDRVHPNALHPDQHMLVTVPGHPFRFFEGNDGGVMRSSGRFSDVSSWCDGRGLSGDELARCQQLLSKVPSRLGGVNSGISSLQFQSLSVSPFDSHLLQGGTQDNGTWQNGDRRVTWRNKMIGDGGQSGFDTKVKSFRFHTFYDASPDVNFHNGRIGAWIWTGDPIFGQPGTQFYVPIISDPRVSGTMFVGTGTTVYRTTTFGLGHRSRAQANRICNEWTGTFAAKCGDWKPTGLVPLTSDQFGDREGGAVAAVERTKADRSTAWAATTTGRVFVSHNVDASNPDAVTWRRLDTRSPNAPQRFVSSIYVDPKNPDRAWVSYSGYSSNTPTAPGHVFRVDVTGRGATWTDLSGNMSDLPVTDLVRDDVTGDLYASTDFGVMRRAAGSSNWTKAAPGMPNVEVAGLTILPRSRLLYAATHGLSAYRLRLR